MQNPTGFSFRRLKASSSGFCRFQLQEPKATSSGFGRFQAHETRSYSTTAGVYKFLAVRCFRCSVYKAEAVTAEFLKFLPKMAKSYNSVILLTSVAQYQNMWPEATAAGSSMFHLHDSRIYI